VILRHHSTEVVAAALRRVAEVARIEMTG
jgi:hypothetical protein